MKCDLNKGEKWYQTLMNGGYLLNYAKWRDNSCYLLEELEKKSGKTKKHTTKEKKEKTVTKLEHKQLKLLGEMILW